MRLSAFAVLAAATLFCAPAARAAANDVTVPAYHADAARSGHYVVPGLTWAHAPDMQRDAAFDGHVPGNVYAQPLYWHPPGAAGGLVIVATEDNAVVALDAATGRTVWQRSLGPAFAASALACGDIDPLGITGTPVIDEQSGALYLDAVVDRGTGARHLVFGLSLADGAVLPGWPVDMADSLHAIGERFDPSSQNQRGALLLVGDQLYVPYSGHFGGCGSYHGWAVGLRLDRPGVFGAWRSSASGGGIWAPGGIAYDGQHLFAITGMTAGASEWSGGDAVIRLPPDLHWQPAPQTFFAPSDWRASGSLGGINPLPVDLPSDGGPAAALLIAFGGGHAYLLDRANLGGIGHPLGVQQVAEGAINSSPTTYRAGHDVIVAFQAGGPSCPGEAPDAGLVALRISGGPQPAMHTAWCAGLDGWGSPIVTTSDAAADPIVWVVGAEGDNRLHAFRGDTGQTLFTGDPLPGLRHFVTILAAAGRLYVAGDGRVFAFGFAH
jgi:outer membrane protein assembly factor BamB